jgi:hypothetical protein
MIAAGAALKDFDPKKGFLGFFCVSAVNDFYAPSQLG